MLKVVGVVACPHVSLGSVRHGFASVLTRGRSPLSPPCGFSSSFSVVPSSQRKPNWVEMPLRVWGEESKTSRVDYWHYSVGYPVKKKVRFEDIGPTVAATPYVYTAAPVCKNKDLSCYFKPVPCSPPRQV